MTVLQLSENKLCLLPPCDDLLVMNGGQRSPSQTDSLACGPDLMSRVQFVLLNCRQESTCISYHAEWKRFQSFVETLSTQNQDLPLNPVFAFLLHLADLGFAYSSVKVYLAVVVAHHP